MSISLVDRKSTLKKQIPINSEFLSTTILKKIACSELLCQSSELRLFHYDTDQQYKENQIVKRGDQIHYDISSHSESLKNSENKKKGIIFPQELEKMIQNSKIIVIKSANQENIQKSKDHSLWATTFSNQERLKYFFQTSQNVILLFATNRSYEIKGIARMESEPDRLTDKSVWSGVSNIRLGGNFKIKWLRKKPLSLVIVQKSLGTNFKQTIIKACDGQELDPLSCKKLAPLFQTPEEPYYANQNIRLQPQKKESQKIKSQSLIPLQINMLPFPFNHNQFQMNPPDDQNKAEQQKSQQIGQSESLQSSQSSRKNKKIKKKSHKKSKKSKKHKKSHKKYSSSSDQSSSKKSERLIFRFKRAQKEKQESKKRQKEKERKEEQKAIFLTKSSDKTKYDQKDAISFRNSAMQQINKKNLIVTKTNIPIFRKIIKYNLGQFQE